MILYASGLGRTLSGLNIFRGGWRAILALGLGTLLIFEAAAASQRSELSQQAKQNFTAGNDALKRGNYRAAVRAFQEATELAKDFAPARLNLGLAYYGQKDYENAITSFRKALELDAKSPGASLLLGISYFQIDAPEKAIKPLQDALALKGQDPEVHRWLGMALLSASKYKQAVPHLEKAVEAFPDDASIQSRPRLYTARPVGF